jgi:hypothetical protein
MAPMTKHARNAPFPTTPQLRPVWSVRQDL